MAIQFPEGLIPAVRQIKGMADEEFEQLTEAVPLLAGQHNAASFAEKVDESTSMRRPVALQVAELLRGLRAIIRNSGRPADEVIAEALQTEGVVDTDEPKMDRLAQRLSALADHPAVAVFVTAHDLIFSRERIYSGAQVVLDTTPVIESGDIEAMIVLHTLRIDYQDGAEDKSLRLTLDREDLTSLAGIALEAGHREAKTVEVLRAAGFQVTSYSNT